MDDNKIDIDILLYKMGKKLLIQRLNDSLPFLKIEMSDIQPDGEHSVIMCNISKADKVNEVLEYVYINPGKLTWHFHHKIYTVEEFNELVIAIYTELGMEMEALLWEMGK